MRSLILSFLFVGISVLSFGQAFEMCADAEVAPAMLTTFPSMQMVTIDPLWTADIDYTPTNPAGPLMVGYYSFTVNAMGFYNLDFQTPVTNTILTDVSIGFGDNLLGSACPMDASMVETYNGMLMTGTTVNGGCVSLSPGTVYTIVFALAAQATPGDISFTISSTTGATNLTCAGASPMIVGANTGSNTCSSGLVWYSYVVTNGGDVSLTPSVSVTGTDISTPVITQTSIDGCTTFQTDLAWTCLPVGTVINFEAGDDMAPIEQGNFTVTIVDDPTTITNETCANVTATPTAAPTCMTTTLTTATTNTTMGACPDANSGCTTFETESTVWFAFTTDALAQTLDIEVTNGSISGTEFALIDAAAGCPAMGSPATALGGCQTGGSLMNQTVTPSTTYYIAVSTAAFGVDGTFTLTVTPQNPPLNDICATGAIDISATAAAGVDGTTACATGDLLDFCPATSEDHVVYYTYTVDATITTNRTVTITTGGATIPVSGADATGLGLGIFADCVGTAATMPSGSNLLPVVGTDLCDALTGTKVFECVEPGTSFTIAVASEDGAEGDFNIMITEDNSTVAINDACANATVLAGGSSCTDIAGAGDNTDGCPEISDLGSSCTFSSDLVVWYELTLPVGATGIDFSNLSAGAQLALFDNDCPTLTIVDDCFTGDTEFTSLIDGGTYLLAVSQTLVAEGPVTFTWSPQAIPTNDDCDLGTNPDILLETTGSTGCADYEVTSCGIADPTMDHQVFYTYTNTSGSTVDLEITIEADPANGNPATQVSITAFDDDCAAFVGFYPAPQSNSEWCNILGMGMQTLPCIEDGETIIILMGSIEGEEGDFTIVASQGGTQPVANNDECTDAADITPANTCMWETVMVDNNNACPEDFGALGACGFDVDPVVWYSVTVPAAAGTYQLDIQNITDANSYLTIFDATVDCDNITTAAINADCEMGAGPHGANYDDLTPGSTYLIAFGNPTPGMYTFEIKINLLPENDECAMAEVLALGTPAVNASTICATDDVNDPTTMCDPMTGESSVWYSFDVVTDTKTLTLSLTGLTGGGDVNIMAVDACNSTTYYNDDNNNEVCGTGAADLVIDCPVAGTTIFFMVTTSEAEEGDYTLTLTETQTIDVTNDDCANAIDITPAMTCADLMTTAMTNETACPETFDLGGCGFDVEEVVWFSIDIPMGATTLDLGINSYAGIGNGFFALFSDCTPTQIDGNCYTTVSAGDFTLTEEFDVTGLVNTTILVAFGSNGVNDIGGDVVFDIRIDIPPMNDECNMAEVLIAATATDGTTACATQETTPYNGACADVDETNTVWYTYTVPAGDKGFHVTITAGAVSPFTNPIITSVFETDACDISGATLVGMDNCAAVGLDEQFECVGPGTYTILVSTSADNEGDFVITITPLAQTVLNDLCENPEVLPAQDQCEWAAFTAVTTDACPEDFDYGSDCGFDDFPVVWYSVTAPADADFLDVALNFGGTMPFFAIFPSTIDCDNVTAADALNGNCIVGPIDELGAGNEIPVTENTTYLIAVGANVAGGVAALEFELKWITPPDNDDCADAEDFNALMPSGNPGESSQTLTMETTQCATLALTGSACDPDKTNTVWYTYTVGMDVKEITIDITNYMNTNTDPTAMAEFSLAVFDGCGSLIFLNQADGSIADYCGGEGVDLLKFSCLDEGDVLTILVSSSSLNEGTFDITINTAEPNCTYTNDECINAAPLTGNPDPLITDDPNDCVLVPGCNDLACTEFTFAACGGIDQLNTVFYTFMTDANVDPVDGAFVNIEILNGEAGELDAPGAVLFTGGCVTGTSIGACATGAGGEYNSGPLGGPGVILPNTVYTIMIFNSDTDQNGGTFDLCVTVSSGCVNDDICDAFTLEPGVTVDNPASSTGCTDDFDVSGCGAAQNEATLWYQVDVPEGASSIEIILNNQPVGGVTGDVSIAVGPLVDCNALDVTDVLYADCGGFTTDGGIHTIDCAIEFGTYWIQIGSEDDIEAGDFTITYNFNMNPDPANDLCSTAEDLVVTDICEFVTFPGSLKDACPELFDLGACQYSMNQAVWYTITIPAGPPTVTDMDIEIMGLGSPMIGVFEFDCMNAGDPAANNGIINSTMNPDGTVDCSEMPLTEGIIVTPGNTYHILVSTSAMEDIAFDISIKLNAPPINDDPCITSVNPPLDLSGGGSHAGTTCCARGPKDVNPDGSVADWENQAPCNNTTEDAAVWYMFTPDPADDGYDIIVNGGSISNQMTVQVYGTNNPASLCAGVPTGTGVIASSCSDLVAEIRIPNCDPTLTYFVKVTTSDDDCGEFDISIQPASVCDYADTCEEAVDPLVTSTQETCEDPLEFFTIPGCLDLACPDPAINTCMQMMGPTVWFKINIDDPDATKLITQVDAPGFDAVWQVFEGTSCADMMPIAEQLVVDGTTETYNCSNSDGDAENIFQTPIDPDAIANGLMYWVSVTALGEITDPNFDFVYNSTLGCLACTGEDATDCGNGDFVASVLENGTWVEVEDDYQFCQGIDVQVCFEFNYNTTGSGNDWIHGFVPFFGPGWDVNDDVLASIGALGNFEFFSSQGDCAPFLNGYGLPNVCTYIDDDGFLQLCNSACDPAGCPCTGNGGMQDGDPLPSGFWYNTPGGGSNCGELGCSPANFFGWPSGTNVDVSECIELKTKVFDTVEECLENNSLSFGIQTFSDAVSGCWVDSSPCIVDPSVGKFNWFMECNVPPPVVGLDDEICHNGMVDILLLNGATSTIQVDVVDNPDVTGENSYTFPGGSGSIVDDLLNTSSVTQVVEYIVYTVDPALNCPGKIDTIEVTIYPELMVTFPPASVCEGDCTDITPDIVGGIGAPYMFEWSTGEVTSSINVCPIVPTTYFVTVTDDLGCQGVGEVEVIVRPPVEVLLPESISVCKDDNFDPFNPDYQVCLDFISGSSPYGVQWVTEAGLVGQALGFGECFAINELLSSEFLGSPEGVYTLTANVTDFFGCMGTVDMEVIITGELTIVPMVNDIDCGDTEANITATGLDAAGNAVTTFLLYGGCPDDGPGTFIDEFFSTTGTVLFPTVDLLEYTCYTIIAQTESGCQASIDVEIPLTEGTPIDIGGDEMVCIGSDATITIANASDFTTFVWTPDIGSTGAVTFTPDSTATYIVEATDLTGCTSQILWTVEVNPEPIISLAGALEFCENGTATITASGGGVGGTYEWTGIAGAQSGDSYTTGVSGDATVTVTDINGCVSDSIITFNQVDVIEIILANANICDGMGDTLFVPSNIINVVWEDATPSVVSDTTFYVITTEGTFTVTGEDATTGCDAAGSFTVEEFITPIINIPDTVDVCRLDSGIDSLCIDLVAIASASASGSWNQDGIIPGFTLGDFPLNDVCFTGIQTGCYPFTYTTNSATAPCMDVMKTMMVCVKACPCPSPATQGIPDICNFGTYDLENAELTTDPGTWSVQSGPPGQDLAGIISGAVFTATDVLPGPYVVRFTLDNPGGGSCEVFSEQTINIVSQDVIDAIAQGQLCNIVGQQFPTTLDLFDLISTDATNGGTWMQTGTETMIPITGGSMISSTTITDFSETFTFEYTSGDTGGPCPPTVTEVTVNIFDCTCPILIVGMDTLCNDGLPIDLFTLLTNDDNLPGTWTTNGNLTGTSMFDPNGLSSGAYDITYTLDSSPGAGCPTEFINSVIVRRQAIAELKDPEPIGPCTVDTGNGLTTVNLYDYLEAGYTSGSWTQTAGDNLTFADDGNSIAIVDFMTQDIGEQFTFEFTTQGAEEPCENIVIEVVITVRDCNCPPIGLTDPEPICNDSGMLDLCALVGSSDPGTFTVFDPLGNNVSDIIDVTGCIIDATGLNDNTYTIIYTLDQQVTGACIGVDTVFLDVMDFVNAELVLPPEVCNDITGSGTLSLNFFDYISNANAGTWTDVDGAGVDVSNNLALTNVNFATGNAGGPVPAGTYTFAFEIDNGDPCGDVFLEMVITVVDDCNCPPILPSAPVDVCNIDGPVDLTQYDDPTMPGTWSSTLLTVDNGNSLVIAGVEAGVYELTYTLLTSVPDCPDSVIVDIMIGEPANPGTPAEDLQFCEGDAQVISLDDRLTGADLGGTWTETSTTMSTGFSGDMFDTDGQSAGTYTFQYEITDNEPCPNVDVTVTIIINPNPIADAGTSDLLDCINTSNNLGGTGTSTGGDFTYSWTLEGVEVGTTISLTDVSVVGEYQLLVTNSVTGCADSSLVTVIKSDDLPTFVGTVTHITCNGDADGSIIISDQTGGDGNYNYTLNGGDAVTDLSFTGLDADDYVIVMTDGAGCSSEQIFTILEPDPVSVTIAAEGLIDGIIKGEFTDEFILTIDPVATNIDSVVWSDFSDPTIIFCSGTVAECTSVTIAPDNSTTVVYVEVFDANGCSANSQVQIQLNQIVDVVFPNVISPNGDNINDFFFIASDDVEEVLSMQIFDRWGELIWEKKNFDPRVPTEGWDGKFNESPVAPGVYVFTVEVLFNDLKSTKETFSGDVTVMDGE